MKIVSKSGIFFFVVVVTDVAAGHVISFGNTLVSQEVLEPNTRVFETVLKSLDPVLKNDYEA